MSWLLTADVLVSVDSNLSIEAMLAGVPAINLLNEPGLFLGPCFAVDSGILEVEESTLAPAIKELLMDTDLQGGAQVIDVAAPRASLWDNWNASGGPRYPHEKVVQFTFRNFPTELRRASAALDVRCGSGVHTSFLAAEGFDVTGIDVSSLGVENTRRRLSAAGLTASLETQDVAALELPAEHFQLAICTGVLDCAGLHAARAAVPQILRPLTPGGRELFVFASDRDFRVLGENPYGLHGTLVEQPL